MLEDLCVSRIRARIPEIVLIVVGCWSSLIFFSWADPGAKTAAPMAVKSIVINTLQGCDYERGENLFCC
jgi:hypothetical protein